MITFLSAQAQSFLAGLNAIQQRTQKAQRQLTTGLRINTVSDEPDQIAGLLSVRANISRNDQIAQNLGRVKTETDTAETVLSSAVTLVERAQTLGTQGASDLASADTRNQLAQELGSVLQELVSGANTTVEGRYIFSGDSDQTRPYTIDLTQANPIAAYAGSAATRQVEHPDGTTFGVSKTAQEIFSASAPDKNVFAAVNNLRVALLTNNSAGVNAALAQVTSAGTYLNAELSFYGTAQNNVDSGVNYSATYKTQLLTQLSTIQDADATQAILEFSQAQTDQQAALSSEAKLPRTSLFDFLG